MRVAEKVAELSKLHSPFDSDAGHKTQNVICAPNCGFGAEFYRRGESASLNAGIPRRLADRDELQNLRQTQKTCQIDIGHLKNCLHMSQI